MKYRKKPVIISATQYQGIQELKPGFSTAKFGEMDNEIALAITNALSTGENEVGGMWLDGNELNIFTLEGAMKATPGDYIIMGVHDELYPCKPDIFHKTYEKA